MKCQRLFWDKKVEQSRKLVALIVLDLCPFIIQRMYVPFLIVPFSIKHIHKDNAV